VTTYLGELAALSTSVLWALTSILFTLAGQRAGSRVVNRTRLIFATLFLSIAHLFIQGTLFPTNIGVERLGWLALSAIVGLIIGDGLLFYAYTQIGPRLSMLMMALSPIMGTLLAWMYLDETMHIEQLIAILVTISGVGWVVMKRQELDTEPETSKNYVLGILCGLGGGFGQAIGLILSKQGMTGDFSTLSASLIRVTSAMITIWIIAAARRQVKPTIQALQDTRALKLITAGSLVGPTLGMTLSLVAVQTSQVGIASTLMSLSPIFLLPLSRLIFQEQIDLRAIAGTIVAMVGVAMLFLA